MNFGRCFDVWQGIKGISENRRSCYTDIVMKARPEIQAEINR